MGELASKAGIDAAALEETVARYNSFFEDGLERDPDYYRYTGNNKPFTGETYYALVTNSVILATVGGLTINGDTQVLDKDGKGIEGLYATCRATSTQATTRAIFPARRWVVRRRSATWR